MAAIDNRLRMKIQNTYILVFLTAHLAIAHLDRQILAIGLPDIREQFLLTDIQLGLLSGVAFGLLFGLCSIPLTLLIRQVRRDLILSISIGIWSLLTLLGGVASGFMQLFASRLGVGAAEASAIPTAQSIIADTFKPPYRATAMSIYTSGASIGVALALIGGGFLIQNFGWRVGFLAAGVPGLVLAVILAIVFRRFPAIVKQKHIKSKFNSDLWLILGVIWRLKDLRYMVCGCVLISMTIYSGTVWVPSFLSRIHGLDLFEIGIFLALIAGLCGVSFTIGLTYISGYLSRRRPFLYYLIPATVILVAKLTGVIAFTSQSTLIALGLIAAAGITGTIHYVITLNLLHSKFPETDRPLVAAILISLTNLIGMGLGPLLTGIISTFLAPDGSALGTAIAMTQGFAILGAISFLVAGSLSSVSPIIANVKE